MIKNKEINTDFEVRSLDNLSAEEQQKKERWFSYTKYLVTGILFGIILIKAEVIFMVSYTGNVSPAKFSHVRCNWFCSSNRHSFNTNNKEV